MRVKQGSVDSLYLSGSRLKAHCLPEPDSESSALAPGYRRRPAAGISALFIEALLNGVHQHPGNGNREGGFDFTNAGGAGDVNFRQAIADDIQADED